MNTDTKVDEVYAETRCRLLHADLTHKKQLGYSTALQGQRQKCKQILDLSELKRGLELDQLMPHVFKR